jgi:hypothetical protein
MRGIDMLVATSADFAVLRDGRPVAGGAWGDVVEARASVRARNGALALALRLRGGAELVVDDGAPGWDDLVEQAAAALPGMPAPHAWWPAGPPAPDAEVVLFDRRGGAA